MNKILNNFIQTETENNTGWEDIHSSLSRENLLIIRELIQKRTGLFFPESKFLMLKKSIHSIFLNAQATTFNEYIAYLASKKGEEHFKKLISLITINETYFFRGKEHFEILKNHLLPELIAKESSNSKTLSIWSAGCSTGEEAYSIAMIVKELIPEIDTWKINIIASDIDETALNTGRKGEYNRWSFRSVEPNIISKYFTRKGDIYQVKEGYKPLVSFINHNLLSDPPPDAGNGNNKFDIILCRNVTIYFKKETTMSIASKFHQCLREEGYLIVGHSEYSTDNYIQFKSRVLPNAIIYQKITSKKSTNDVPLPLPLARKISSNKPTVNYPPQSKNVNLHEHRNAVSEETALFNEAIHYYNNKNYESAIDRFFRVLDINPENIRACWMLCHISANMGHYEDAIAWGNRCIMIDPLFKESYYILSIIHTEQKEFNEAINKLKKVIYIDPDFALGYFALGNIYALMHLRPQADECFKAASNMLKSKPSDEVIFQTEHLTVKELLNLIELKFRTV